MNSLELKRMRIVMIGAGNVAHHIAVELLNKGYNLCQIYSRTIESAIELSKKTGISYTTDLKSIYPDCDLYIFAVSDRSIRQVASQIHTHSDAIYIHTSGSMAMDQFEDIKELYGVFYPLQSFTKRRVIEFSEIPILIEANSREIENMLEALGHDLSNRVEKVNSEKRKKLHLAAVFVNNFSNHLYELASDYLVQMNLDGKLLGPLIEETANRILTISPHESQTGPAKRGDLPVLEAHRSMLANNEQMLTLYNVMSDSIQKSFQEEKIHEETPNENKEFKGTLW